MFISPDPILINDKRIYPAAKISIPKISTAEISTPKTSTPKTSTPKTSTPKTSTPKTSTPKMSTPAFGQQLVFHITHHVDPARNAEYMARLRDVRGKATSDRCVSFKVARNNEEPNTYRIIMVFDASKQWFENNVASKDYFQELVEHTYTDESAEDSEGLEDEEPETPLFKDEADSSDEEYYDAADMDREEEEFTGSDDEDDEEKECLKELMEFRKGSVASYDS